MREEHQLLGVILKSQPLGEADSLVTWFTRESGKIRTLVVSARRMHSKLGFALLPGSTVAFRITQRTGHGSLARLIQATPVAVYVRDFAEGRGLILQWLQEIILRATPDEQPNEEVFSLIVDTFAVLAQPSFSITSVPAVMFGVLTHACASLGFGIQLPTDGGSSYFFNIEAGGFVPEAVSGDDWFLITEEVDRFIQLSRMSVAQLGTADSSPADERLRDLAAHFFEYQIERAVQSSRLFGAILQ